MPEMRKQIVRQMQAYGVFLQDHAEDIVGKLSETYVAADGITVSFKVLKDKEVPTIRASIDYLPTEVLDL